MKQLAWLLGAACVFSSLNAHARGVSPYLPLNLAPEIEGDIERALILADKPVMSRPIAAATLLDALPAVCAKDPVLCHSLYRFLDRYKKKLGLSDASVEVAASDSNAPLPNRRGVTIDDAVEVSAHAYWQPKDWLLVSVGGVASDDVATPSGTLLSLGGQYGQLDIGWREHWLSPFTDSAMLMSTQAQTLPSITLSNYQPVTRFGLQYELFLARMGYSDQIAFEDRTTAGHPSVFGMRITMEPAAGWSLSGQRLMQFGGGERESSFSGFRSAFFDPRGGDNRSDSLTQDQEFGNELASWTSRFIFPGRVPFSVYLEYAGEDTSYEGNYRLGNSSLSIGIDFPRLWNRFDLTYEASEWQNAWYVNGLYGEGFTEEGHVLGHWGGDQRVFGDAVGAQTHMLRVGWDASFGGRAEVRARTIANESYSTNGYQRGYDVTLSYSRVVHDMTVGGELTAGKDVFGETYGRLAGFVRVGGDWQSGGLGWASASRGDTGSEIFIDAGVNASNVLIRFGDGSDKQQTSTKIAPHIGIGARREVSSNSDLGVRLEIDEVNDNTLLAVRALDYRYRFNNPLALSIFLGAARYDLATPAYGYYLGGGLQWRNVFKNVDVGVDYRYADKVARDKLLPSDPAPEPRPDEFYDISGVAFSVSYRF